MSAIVPSQNSVTNVNSLKFEKGESQFDPSQFPLTYLQN